ncbi:response regulator transcription factor [Burkholderia sp. FERM BP-3421]|jgi:two-component system, NarL family, captular synthesis response regulator RcsB|uniref:response regulator transcription factor n=1 Tax=Burkholderia sp. FERM BP-3421 TaxID=1494466 RepID=UPI00235EF1BD|nr:response regulator transcription factor [Burkholderia sp. FERM BP-3421]WDD92472.1 response regulator transcription factor [Burkholderia sp. FERM BP-3421]
MISNRKSITLAILDDHAAVQHGIEHYLADKTDIDVRGNFSRSRDLLRWLESHQVDVVLLDYVLGPDEIDGLNLIRLVHTRFQRCEILMTSSIEVPATVNLMMRAGAKGFIGKSQDLRELAHAVHVVARGKTYLSMELASIVPPARDGRAGREAPTVTLTSASSPAQLAETQLSPREHEVLRCCLNGMTVSEIAIKFSRSRKTISAQKQSAFRKLGVRNDLELFASRKPS